jgi:hypothetical protein
MFSLFVESPSVRATSRQSCRRATFLASSQAEKQQHRVSGLLETWVNLA